MNFTVKDLISIKIHNKISLAVIEVVTDKLIHCRRLEDNEWFMFYDKTYNDIIWNFGQISINEFYEKYPELVI